MSISLELADIITAYRKEHNAKPGKLFLTRPQFDSLLDEYHPSGPFVIDARQGEYPPSITFLGIPVEITEEN